jgi:hypothetical protein
MGLHPVSMKKFSVLVEMVSFAGCHPTLIEFEKVWGSLTYVVVLHTWSLGLRSNQAG